MRTLQKALLDLQSKDSNVRELCLDTIGTLQPENAFEIIAPFLKDPNPEVRGTAACNLGEINDCRSIELLIDTIRKDPEEKVRAEALEALEYLEDYRTPEILECLIEEVYRDKKSRRPRQIVARQLQFYDTEESLAALSLLLLQDEDFRVRIWAADSLLALNRPRLKKIWEEALQDGESTYVQEIASRALADLADAQRRS